MSDAGEGCDRRFGLPWPELNDGLSYEDVVPPSDDGSTVIEFYGSKYRSSAPLQGWLQRIRNGQITVDGCVTTIPDERLRTGSKLVYHRLPWKEPDTPYLIEILYEDEHMIALNKPSGLQVLPGGLFQQRTVLSQLQWRERKRTLQMGHEPQPVPVHRLGRGTSGILLCAKTKIGKSRLSAYFADGTSLISGTRNIGIEPKPARKITKYYRALVNGILGEDELIINQPIGTAKYAGVAKGLYVATPSGDPLYVQGGKPRCFTFSTEEESFALDGGHTRPQHALPGDCGYFLHAHELILSHPMTDEVLTITAPLPSILQTQSDEVLDSSKSTVE